VDAYSKDAATGIVLHDANTCIGCQYCTWNCSYGVPQYNPERGVVGKCDMCHGRLALGQAPACVSACPESAIRIEIVKVADWREKVAAAAPATGLPLDDASLSTTRITMRDDLPPTARPLDLTHVRPAEPHWPLVVMTVLTQMSVGAFAAIWLLQLAGATDGLGTAAIASLMVGALALSASTIHLGRPIFAYRALKMWRRSWLSREVLLFTAFSGIAALYAGLLWLAVPGAALVGALTVAFGAGGVIASGCIYRVASRPAWNTWLTVAQFAGTAAVLGPGLAAALHAGNDATLQVPMAAFAALVTLAIGIGFLRLIASDSVELRGTARLLSRELAPLFLARIGLLIFGAIVLPLAFAGPAALVTALAVALAGEIVGRYLFFVSVVPKHMTTPYLAMGSEAA
jgi:DMSO reductase anchor subunit/ferredoxin